MLYDELFDNALAIERTIETLYRRYAEIFRDEPDVAELFGVLATEEERHVRILDGMDRRVEIKGQVESPLPMIKSQRDLIELADRYQKEAAGPVSVRDALRNAFRLENSLPEKSLKKIRSLVDGGLAETFQRMTDETIEHARRVREFARSKDIRFSGEA